MINVRISLILVVSFAAAAATTSAFADSISKEACVDAHSRGQDARDKGQLSLARKLFLQCAQNACPALVQGDCARFADDMTRSQPTVTFAARDASGADLPDTTVYIDDTLIVTRLDGKPHDIDPGNHAIKFQNGGRDFVVTIVINNGEKGRTVVGNFPAPGGTGPTGPGGREVIPAKPVATTNHPGGSKITLVVGGLMFAGGMGLAAYGYATIPDGCDLGTHQCSAGPGDKVFADASTAVRRFDTGLVIGGIGAVALIGGLVWYVSGAETEKPEEASVALRPFIAADGGGFAFGGRF